MPQRPPPRSAPQANQQRLQANEQLSVPPLVQVRAPLTPTDSTLDAPLASTPLASPVSSVWRASLSPGGLAALHPPLSLSPKVAGTPGAGSEGGDEHGSSGSSGGRGLGAQLRDLQDLQLPEGFWGGDGGGLQGCRVLV